jgi:dihydrofolate reductase
MPRRVRYLVAPSLDGYIAGVHDEYDWIVSEDRIDFPALFAQFDTFLMGRRTWEMLPPETPIRGEVVVFSRTLRAEDHPGVTIVADRPGDAVRALRARPGKDIWLFGGGQLFRTLLELGEVDTVEVAVMPVLIGGGIPLLPGPPHRHRLELTGHQVYPESGIVLLAYAVVRG